MQTSRTRLMAISGATLALIVAGTAAVSAHPGHRDERGIFGRGGFGSFERDGLFGLREGLRMGIPGEVDQLVRRETSFETDEGLVTQRVDNGTATATTETSLDYGLADGGTASVSIDGDTEVMALRERTVELGRRGIARQRLVGERAGLDDIEAGSQIVVWSQSQDDGTFLAQRILIRPTADAAADEAGDAASSGDVGADEEPSTEDGTTGTITDV